MKKLIEKYNTPDTLVMVSLYPHKSEVYSAGASGIASYAKNVVSNMTKQVIVLTDYTQKPEIYEENNVLVIRCFNKKSPLMWLQLLKALIRFKAVSKVLVQFDFALYGNMINSAFIFPFLLFLRILGYHTSVVIHSVVLDIRQLSGHVGLGKGLSAFIKGHLYNSIFHLFYFLIGIIAKTIIVLEEPLKKKLSSIIRNQKIVAIPHGVDTKLTTIDKKEARKKLGLNQQEHVVLFFGFVNWFKGADFFVDTFTKTPRLLNKKTSFIVAGGVSATLNSKSHYKEYFAHVQKTIQSSQTIEMTGYVPQEKIGLYFSACDLVVFPYRYFMNASGVLSLVFSYQKPFIVSEHIAEMFDAPDFKETLSLAGLTKKDLVFSLNSSSCIAKTEEVLKNGLKQKMIYMAGAMKSMRTYKNTAFLYEETLFIPSVIIEPAETIAVSYNE